jgi:hypothetical protein
MRFGGMRGCVQLADRAWGVRNPCALRRVTGGRCKCCGAGQRRGWQFLRMMYRQRRCGVPAHLRGFAATAGNLRLAW